MLCCVGTSIFDWRLCLAITSHHDVAITTSLVVLCPLSIALRGVELRFLDGESKVGVDDVRGWQLLVVVLKGLRVFYLLLASPPVQLSGRSNDTLAGLWASSRSSLV